MLSEPRHTNPFTLDPRDSRKIACAAVVKAQASVSNDWIVQRLAMAHPASMSQMVNRIQRDPIEKNRLKGYEKTLKTQDWYDNVAIGNNIQVPFTKYMIAIGCHLLSPIKSQPADHAHSTSLPQARRFPSSCVLRPCVSAQISPAHFEKPRSQTPCCQSPRRP